MAQRNTPKTAAQKAAASKQKAKPQAAKSAKPAPGRPPARKPGKSIVNQKQTPWGLIVTTVVLVLFAAGIVTYAVTRHSGSDNGGMNANPENRTYVLPEVAAAKKIPGMIYKKEPNHNHVAGTVTYNTSPPIGGDHSPYWADCTGTVYDHQIANENAVHMLEHGAVWITYNPKTATTADVTKLKSMVDGVDRLALSPYAGLKTPISLQAWNYQLFVNKATDPRVEQFVDALRYNPKTLPEDASCSDPSFKADQSTPGHPFEG
jgi:hypothetical protein